MRLLDRLRNGASRADVRTAWIIGVSLLVAVLVPGILLYAYATEEALEEVDRWFAFALQVAAREVEERGPQALALGEVTGRLPDPAAAVRVLAPNGEILAERGRWPDPEREVRARLHQPGEDVRRHLGSSWQVREENWMVGEHTTPSGIRIQLALPLYQFASDYAQVRSRLVLGAAVAAAAVLLVSLATTIRAFSPLRRATALLRDLDMGSLGMRLASRETGDPIDQHAETLNHVLARIDAGFGRLRAFSSDVAHELRTPLNRISTVSEVALLAGGERELRAALEGVHATTEDLARVVQALLLLAEIDDRRVVLQPKPIDLRSWLRQHVEAYAPSFEEAGVAIAADGEPLAIEGDRVLLDRIIANLLDNALVHAPPGSRVEVHSARRDGGVVIAVDDEGRGIAEIDRERVFDRFARLDAANGTGHGLGLALARAIAEAHGGTLRVMSSARGGARFELWLPQDGASA